MSVIEKHVDGLTSDTSRPNIPTSTQSVHPSGSNNNQQISAEETRMKIIEYVKQLISHDFNARI